MTRPLNSRQIEAFRAVILTGGMTAGGEMLGISQPAISRLVRDLEQDLDLKLFERNGARIIPTGEALILYQDVERLFIGSERIRESAMAIRNLRSGSLRIAAMPDISLGYLPKLVRNFLENRPRVSVTIHSDMSINVIDLVAKNQFDIGLAFAPGGQAGVEVRPLPVPEAVCVLPLGHRLADRAVIHANDLDGEDFISLGQSSLLRVQIQTALEASDAQCNFRIETRYAGTAIAFVAQGLGVTIVDPFAISQVALERVVRKPFRPRIGYESSIVFPAQRPKSGLAEEFAEEVRQSMERDFGPIEH